MAYALAYDTIDKIYNTINLAKFKCSDKLVKNFVEGETYQFTYKENEFTLKIITLSKFHVEIPNLCRDRQGRRVFWYC